MMALEMTASLLARIQTHGESAYPEEGAGFLLGADGDPRRVTEILPLPNTFEAELRQRRYLIAAEAYSQAEDTADGLGLSLIGVFHSHPDHPNHPSETDREWAQPFFSYIITSVEQGRRVESRSWRLAEDRSGFLEEQILVVPD
jgi:proteasome lid subunit RPN8/RPN11